MTFTLVMAAFFLLAFIGLPIVWAIMAATIQIGRAHV